MEIERHRDSSRCCCCWWWWCFQCQYVRSGDWNNRLTVCKIWSVFCSVGSVFYFVADESDSREGSARDTFDGQEVSW